MKQQEQLERLEVQRPLQLAGTYLVDLQAEMRQGVLVSILRSIVELRSNRGAKVQTPFLWPPEFYQDIWTLDILFSISRAGKNVFL